MLGDITVAKEIYIACGYTDMRKSIDGLAALVQETDARIKIGQPKSRNFLV